MIVGLVGSRFSGKSTLAKYLEQHHQFERVDLNNLQPELQPLPVPAEENSPDTTSASSATEETKEPVNNAE